jgi:hypothetical protein
MIRPHSCSRRRIVRSPLCATAGCSSPMRGCQIIWHRSTPGLSRKCRLCLDSTLCHTAITGSMRQSANAAPHRCIGVSARGRRCNLKEPMSPAYKASFRCNRADRRLHRFLSFSMGTTRSRCGRWIIGRQVWPSVVPVLGAVGQPVSRITARGRRSRSQWPGLAAYPRVVIPEYQRDWIERAIRYPSEGRGRHGRRKVFSATTPCEFLRRQGAGLGMAWKVFSTIPLYARTPLSIVAKRVSENFAVLLGGRPVTSRCARWIPLRVRTCINK